MVKQKNADTTAASTLQKKNKGHKKNKGKKKNKKKKIASRVKLDPAQKNKGSDANLDNHVPSTSKPFERPDTWRDIVQVRLS